MPAKVDQASDGLREPRTDLHDVGLVRAEHADRAPGLVAAQTELVRVMLGHVVVIAHQGLEIVDRDGLFGREIDLEIAAVVIDEVLDEDRLRVTSA